MIKLYNTLTKQKEILKTIEENKVRMYVCGPTVYNYIHIGNARPIIVFDVVRKYLEHSGYEVDFISNFTDVDDKIIKASNEEGISTSELTEKYITAFFKDYDALGCKRATKNPRVTEYMREIIDFISKLVEEGFAYEANGDVYFRTRKKEDYGKLSKQSIDDLISGARIEVGEHKEDPLDFALWKKAKPGEVKWNSPFGEGRPGWHIECSVMAKETLGDTIVIHAGGQDLTFPHHENEIAQSECHNHASFSNYWMHNAFINIDNVKMSKSLGNFRLVKDIIAEIDPMVLRLFMLTVHYRTPINYTLENIELAKTNFEKIKTSYQNLQFRLNNDMTDEKLDTEVVALVTEELNKFEEYMQDDFNTANALSSWYEIVRISNSYTAKEAVNKETLELINAAFETYSSILGISVKEDNTLNSEHIESLIAEREEARKNRDFALADKIRDDLKEQGIILEDITFKFTEKNFANPNQMQALTLAYIGDSIYDIMSREYVMKNHLGKINDLHKTVSTIVSARAQASFMENILNNSILTEQEEKIYNRAKNQKNNSKAKNASIMEYKLATGLEAVFGYLYLEKNFERLEEMFNYIIRLYEEKQ